MAYTRRGMKGGCKATTLNGSLSAGATSIVCTDLSTWSGVNTNGPATAVINRGLSDEEVVTFTGISSNTLTGVTKGAAGTSDQAHATGTIEHSSSFTDFDEANAHIADTTLDHHTQYARTDGTRVITGIQAFSATTGTTHESNRVDSRAQAYGKGFAYSADNEPHRASLQAGLSIAVNRATPAAVFDNPGGDALDTYSGANNTFAVDKDGGVMMTHPSAIVTTATSGFFAIRYMAGPPTGAAVTRGASIPVVYDTTNDKVWFYNGSWRGIAVT